MSDYQLQIKQIVDYPRCRIYRQFIQSLISDRSIRTGGNSGLFYFTVLCSYANFRTSYRRIDGIGYTIYPGEWICTVKEMSVWFRTHFQWQTIDILEELQRRHLISYLILDRGKVIKYKIRGWKNHNTVLDLWLSTIYNDEQVQGSKIGPVVYLRNDTNSPLVNYSELAVRWGISKATVGRILKKFAGMEYISLMTFPGRTGSVIYLKNYLSTMFQISDVLIDKEEVAMVLNIKISLPEEGETVKNTAVMERNICVSNELSSVSKSHMEIIIEKMAQILDAQGISCFQCPKSIYKLYPLSDACREEYLSHIPEAVVRIGMTVSCGEGKPVYTFELTLSPNAKDREGASCIIQI